MCTSHEVTCIVKGNGHNGRPTVSHIGGQTPEGRGWRMPMTEAFDGILKGRWIFFITVEGKRHDLRVTVDRDGARYLAVKDEAASGSGLIELPECKHGGTGI
jgi:hypothetical protein